MTTIKKAVAKKSVVKQAVVSVAPVPVVPQDRIGWRSLYLYAVCLITLLVALFAVVSLINNATGLFFPDPVYSDPYVAPMKPGMTSEIMRQQQVDGNVRRSIRAMINSFTTVVIAAPLYVYHWRMARKTY